MNDVHGYGRYEDGYIRCPRARTDMTLCIAREGADSLDHEDRCHGCNKEPQVLLKEIRPDWSSNLPKYAADLLKSVVFTITKEE